MDSILFGVMLTIVVFNISVFISKKYKIAILNPILLSMIIIIGILKLLDIKYDDYYKGASLISFYVAPATIALVVPLYKNINLLKKNFIQIIIGIFVGTLVGVVSTIFLAKIFRLDKVLLLSLLPKSTTSSIAADISKSIGGEGSITLVFVTIVGILGNTISPKLLEIIKIKSDIAKGVSIGTASHVVGTAKATEMGEEIGAMSSLAITVSGMMSVFLIPLVLRFI